MDIGTVFKLFKPLLSAFWWVFALMILSVIFRTAWFKGVYGEMRLRFAAWLYLDATQYWVLHDITLMGEQGSTQIDHIFISRFGIFVVETKNFGGWIFGSEKQARWTQKLFKTSNQFQNPLHQNFLHVKTLQQILALPIENFHSLVVFVGSSSFKTETPPNVTNISGCFKYIASKTDVLLSDEQAAEIFATLQAARLAPSLASSREHVRSVKSRIAAKKKP